MREFRDALILNGLIAAGAFGAFYSLHAPMLGLAILALVVAFNVLVPLFAGSSGHRHWLDLWTFLLPLSIFQVVPDWVLAQQLGVLSYPELGAPRIGGYVPVYMAGMWVIPLFWVILVARGSIALATVLGLAVFAGAEWAAPIFDIWRPQNVSRHYGIADYVLLPEALLTWAAAYAYREVGQSGLLTKVAAAAVVSILYTGALVTSYFLIERATF